MIWFFLGLIWGFAISAICKASKDAENYENACYRTPQMVVERAATEHNVINYCCPTCNNVVNARLKERHSPTFAKADFCNKCGQALDWGE